MVSLSASAASLREGAAERDAGQRRRDLAGGAADARRGGHLGIEGLDLARPAVQEQEDDRLVLHRPQLAAACRGGPASPGSVRPPRARLPTWRKARREAVVSRKVSMVTPL